MEDKDLVRVDLLKFRRKAYLSYPPGSPERKTFLKTILQNELRLTEQEVPMGLLDFLIQGDNHVLHDTIKHVLLCFFAAAFSGVAAFMSRPLFHGIVSAIFFGAFVGCILSAIQPIRTYFSYRKSINTVKQYSNDMKKYMNRISNDIRRLDGPR